MYTHAPPSYPLVTNCRHPGVLGPSHTLANSIHPPPAAKRRARAVPQGAVLPVNSHDLLAFMFNMSWFPNLPLIDN